MIKAIIIYLILCQISNVIGMIISRNDKLKLEAEVQHFMCTLICITMVITVDYFKVEQYITTFVFLWFQFRVASAISIVKLKKELGGSVGA